MEREPDRTVIKPWGEQDPRTGLHRGYEVTPEAEVGAKVRVLRQERGWSQAELARRLGDNGYEMHQVTVAKLEGAGRPIRWNEMKALAAVFEVPVSTLDADDDDAVKRAELRAQVADAGRRVVDAEAVLDAARKKEARLRAELEAM